MPLFGKSQKTPAELVKALKEAVNSLERGDKKAEKAQEDVSKNLVSQPQLQTYICTIDHISRAIVIITGCRHHRDGGGCGTDNGCNNGRPYMILFTLMIVW